MSGETALVTGFPNFVVKKLVDRLVSEGHKVYLLCKDDYDKEAEKVFAGPGESVHVISGDVVAMDLGLAGAEVKELRTHVTVLYHLAGIYYLGSGEAEMELVNVEGTRNVLAFALELPRLRRFMYYSTAFVSGNREGVVLEDELVEPHKFRNPFERTKFIAEKIVRETMTRLPITIVRPSLVVGDSKTGEIDYMDGPYFFMHVLVNLPLNIHLPLVGRGAFPLNLVPVDYVVEAMVYLAGHKSAERRTFHLVDQNPLSSRKVFQLLCEAANKKPPRRVIPPNLATVLMKMPGLEKQWRSPRLFVECLNQLVLYNAMNTTEVFAGSGITCPPFPSYVRAIASFLKRRHVPRKKR